MERGKWKKENRKRKEENNFDLRPLTSNLPRVGIVIVILLLPVFVRCASHRATVQDDGSAMRFDKEQVWQLVEFGGRKSEVGNPPTSYLRPPTSEIILMFHPESGTLRGHVACNRYFADYVAGRPETTAAGSRYQLEIKYVSGGDVQCPEGGMAEQERYLALLGKADACLLTATTLTLFRKGKEILKFELQ